MLLKIKFIVAFYVVLCNGYLIFTGKSVININNIRTQNRLWWVSINVLRCSK